jgi:hypothetical protein
MRSRLIYPRCVVAPSRAVAEKCALPWLALLPHPDLARHEDTRDNFDKGIDLRAAEIVGEGKIPTVLNTIIE